MPIEIDDKFVDVDFEKDPLYVFGDQGARLFGDPRFHEYGDVVPVIPESEWKGLVEKMEAESGGNERLITRIFNQGNEGSCVGNAGTQAHQIVQALQFGKESVVQLSASSLYKQIGRSPSSGAMVDDALEAGTGTGILPLDTPENRAKFGEAVLPHTGFNKPFPSNYKETAKKFRYHECLVIRNVAQLVTAGINQHPTVVGRAGHSIVYCRPTYKNGKLGFIYVNSWGQWGFAAGDFDSGFGFDSLSMVNSSARWAYAVRSVVVPAVAA